MQIVPTMKTIDETAKYFNLPKHFVRQTVLDGKVIFVKAGAKYLINIEKYAQWLNNGDQEALENMVSKKCAGNPELINYGQLRQVK